MSGERIKNSAYCCRLGAQAQRLYRRYGQYSAVARQMGITDNTVKQWLRWYRSDHDAVDVRAGLEETFTQSCEQRDDSAVFDKDVHQIIIAAAKALGVPQSNKASNLNSSRINTESSKLPPFISRAVVEQPPEQPADDDDTGGETMRIVVG